MPGSYEVRAGEEVRYFKIVTWALRGRTALIARLVAF